MKLKLISCGFWILLLTACQSSEPINFVRPTPIPTIPAVAGPSGGPSIPLTVGTTYRGTIRVEANPPCDPQGWDASAPCLRFALTPSSDGTLDLALTWTDSASEMDLLLENGYTGTTKPLSSSMSVAVRGGVRYELRIHSYYSTQDFELTTTLR